MRGSEDEDRQAETQRRGKERNKRMGELATEIREGKIDKKVKKKKME